MNTCCNVCGREFTEPIYESPDEYSITTMNKLLAGKTRVYFCSGCGHLQTNELPNLKDYYAHEYEINLSSNDDDQIYAVIDGKPVFRADHQAAVLSSKVNWFSGCRVLDYGCAKAPTLKKILEAYPDIKAYLFDVSDKYVQFWQRFPKSTSWSVHHPDPSWFGTLDIVLSFYALEHVSDLHAALANVKSLLKTGGLFYFIVPNVSANIADFIVADHVNHFSPGSLNTLLKRNGFGNIDIDMVAHDAAFVVTARLETKNSAAEEIPLPAVREQYLAACETAKYWRETTQHIRKFVTTLKSTDVIAIYGAGFYGNLIASLLPDPERVFCFIDQNPHLQGSDMLGKKVVSPKELPEQVTHVLVGLNPRKARTIIDSITSWRNRELNYFYL